MGEGESKGRPTPRVNELRELMKSGRLPVGTVLVHKDRQKALDAEATVVSDGLRVKGQVYPSVSTAARAVAAHAVNGWKFWRLESGALLSSLRSK